MSRINMDTREIIDNRELLTYCIYLYSLTKDTKYLNIIGFLLNKSDIKEKQGRTK